MGFRILADVVDGTAALSGNAGSSAGNIWIHRRGIIGGEEITIDFPSLKVQFSDDDPVKFKEVQISITGRTICLIIEAMALDPSLCHNLKPEIVERIRAARGVNK